jgi:hypothetical protein
VLAQPLKREVLQTAVDARLDARLDVDGIVSDRDLAPQREV